MSLNILKGVLEEELERKKEVSALYQEYIDKINYCGKLNIKKIHGDEYVYINYRENKSVKPKIICIGNLKKLDPQKLDDIKEQARRWKVYNNNKKEADEDVKKIERMLKII